MNTTSLTFADIETAHKRILSYIHRTPILTSRILNERTGAELFFKCENFQRVGAFKARGAFNTIFSLHDDEAKKGIVTHSSGNHAAAVALDEALLVGGRQVTHVREAAGPPFVGRPEH